MEATDNRAAGDDRELLHHRGKPTWLIELSEQGVCLGSGIGSLKEQYETSIALDKGVSLSVSLSKHQLSDCRALREFLRSSCLSCLSISLLAIYQ
jgi:hypothetical protein